jgi:pentatricopeptide repeat protein
MMEMAEAGTFDGIDSLPKRGKDDVVEEVSPEEMEKKGNEEPRRGEIELQGAWRPLQDEASGPLVREKTLRLLEGMERNRNVSGQLKRRNSLSEGDLEGYAGARRYQHQIWKTAGTRGPPEVSLPHDIIPKRFRNLRRHVGEAVKAFRPEPERESPTNPPITSTLIQSNFKKVVSAIPEELSHQSTSTSSETITDDVLLSPTQEYFRSLVSHARRSTTQLEDYVIIDRLNASDYSGALHEYWMRRELPGASGSTSTQMLHALFVAALLANEPGSAELIFEELEKDDHAVLNEFNLLLSSYHRTQDEEKMAKVYINYSRRFPLLTRLYFPLLAALLNTKRLAAAEELIEDALHRRGQITLKSLQDLCASFLSKLWVNSRDLRLVESRFDKLCTREGGNLVTFKLYNSVIQACAESHEDSKAHQYYDKMISTQNLSPDVRTGLLILELDASKGDWDAVKRGLQELHESGVTITDAGVFMRSFTRLLNTYKMHHTASSTWDFISDAIHKYGLVPDQILSNDLLSVCARDGNLGLVVEWFNLVSKKGWDIVFNSKTFAMMFEWYWRGTNVPYEHLCVLIQACVKLLGNVGLGHRGHRMLSHDVIDTIREAVMWEHRHSRQGPLRRVMHQLSSIEVQYSDSNSMAWKDWRRDPDQLRKKMLYKMTLGKTRQAVEYYQQARAAGGLIKRIHVQLAVQASIRDTGTTEQASSLIREAADVQGSQSVIGEILAHNLQTWEPWEGTTELKDALENYYALLERERVKIDHRMIVTAANRVLEFNMAQAAIGLLMWMHESQWSKQVPLGIIPMTVLLRAYIKNRNIRGVEWVINHVLDKNIPIDSEFYYQVWKARQQLVWKKMNERQISGEEPLTLELRTWSMAMDIWVRDVMLRQKHTTDENLQRGFEIIKLANEYGGLGHLRGREAEEVLKHPTGQTWKAFLGPQSSSIPAPLSTRLIESRGCGIRLPGLQPDTRDADEREGDGERGGLDEESRLDAFRCSNPICAQADTTLTPRDQFTELSEGNEEAYLGVENA